MVRKAGLEPARLSTLASKTNASTISPLPQKGLFYRISRKKEPRGNTKKHPYKERRTQPALSAHILDSLTECQSALDSLWW